MLDFLFEEKIVEEEVKTVFVVVEPIVYNN